MALEGTGWQTRDGEPRAARAAAWLVRIRAWLVAFSLPLPAVAAHAVDAVANASGSNAAMVLAMFELFAASIIVAAAIGYRAILAMPTQLGTRLRVLAIVWSLLAIEVYALVLWLQRGLH